MRLSPSIAILRTQTDERLVELARAGSEPAFAAIVERYRRQILRATRRVLAEARAEDAAQQTFMSAWLALRRGDAVVNLRSWLLMIARNTALNALRVQGYDYAELQESLRTSEAPQDELERRDVMRQTLAGLAALPDRQREALLRSAVEGASHADIAREMGLTEGATRQLVLRARVAMRGATTALTPWPLVNWLSSRGAADSEAVHRLIEVAVAGGGAGTSALLAKAGVVAVVAGSAVAGPGALVKSSGDAASLARPAAASHAKPAKRAPARTSRAVAVAASVPMRLVSADASTTSRATPSTVSRRRSGERDDERRRHGRSDDDDERSEPSRRHASGHSRDDDDEQDSHRATGSDRSDSSDDGPDGSAPAAGDADADDGDRSGAGSGERSADDDRSGTGSGSAPAPAILATAPASDLAAAPAPAGTIAPADAGERSAEAPPDQL